MGPLDTIVLWACLLLTMRAALIFTLLLTTAGFVGCRSTSVTAPASAADRDLEQQVGERVVLEGVVTNTKCPQVEGVDAWGLEEYRGQRVRVSGILRKTLITEADIDPMVANRGSGTFYSLDEMTYELIK